MPAFVLIGLPASLYSGELVYHCSGAWALVNGLGVLILCILLLLILSACALSFRSEILACRLDICSRISLVDRFDTTDEDRAKAVVGLLVITDISSFDTAAKVLMPSPRGAEESGDVLGVLGVFSSSLSTRRGELKLRTLAGENPPAFVEGDE